jgi:hypothetical protein
MIKYKVIAKDDLGTFPHTWKKGLDYEVVEKTDYFTIASDRGSINYYNTVKNEVLINFEKVVRS